MIALKQELDDQLPVEIKAITGETNPIKAVAAEHLIHRLPLWDSFHLKKAVAAEHLIHRERILQAGIEEDIDQCSKKPMRPIQNHCDKRLMFELAHLPLAPAVSRAEHKSGTIAQQRLE